MKLESRIEKWIHRDLELGIAVVGLGVLYFGIEGALDAFRTRAPTGEWLKQGMILPWEA